MRTIDALRCLLNKFYLISKILSSGFALGFATFFKKNPSLCKMRIFRRAKCLFSEKGLTDRAAGCIYAPVKTFRRKNMDAFKDLRIVDNFYQTSAFFPMPTVLAGTVAENGMTNLGAYSLCFPYYIAGKDYYAMLLECRNSSNTAQNILRGKRVSLNFIPDDKKYFREAVRLGFPGDTTEEKMKNCLFTLIESPLEKKKQ